MEQQTSESKLGVILVNLGTPSEPTAAGVRSFLREFLGDPRVVELPRLLWWPILYGIILPFRSPKVAKLYQEIWTADGSPLKVITEKQTAALAKRFDSESVEVAYAMTYCGPRLDDVIDQLEQKGCNNILILPLYPQYSATTTASIYDQCAKRQLSQRDVSDLTIHKYYFDQAGYIEALAESVKEYWAAHGQPNKLLFSFHGIPKRCVDRGDPYQSHCQMTAERVAKHLRLERSQWEISYQSRLGKAEWLKPYTDLLLTEWAQNGIEKVHVICPAFSSDCLETIEEIDGENRELFLENGGKEYGVVPCLNDSQRHIDVFERIVRQYL